ncbi:hypothetical protein ABTK11_22170, partial [Acinetobacter baumannii]
VASLGFLSPLSAVLLGWGLLNQWLSAPQLAGLVRVLARLWLSQRAAAVRTVAPTLPRAPRSSEAHGSARNGRA